MRMAGYDSYTTTPCNPDWPVPLYDNKPREDDIAIYPEIVLDNPLKAKYVVRYMLYYPSHHFKGQKMPAHEMIVPFIKDFLPECRITVPYEIDDWVLEIPTIDTTDFYNDVTKDRIYHTFYDIKGNGGMGAFKRLHLPTICSSSHTNSIREITPSYPPTRKELADLLQRSVALYSSNHCTMANEEAMLCGSRSYLVSPEGVPTELLAPRMDYSLAAFNATSKMHIFVQRCKSFWSLP